MVRSNTLEAERQLSETGLQPAVTGPRPPNDNLATVLSQVPAAGEVVPVDTVVNLALGVPVPDVTGSERIEAQARLSEVGLRLVMETPEIARTDLLTVLGQHPQPGVVVAVGTRVDLLPGVPVPNVVGMGETEAQAKLAELGLLPVMATPGTSAQDSRTVSSQEPAANEIVPIGASVNLVLSGLGVPWRIWPVAMILLLIFGGAILYQRRPWLAARARRARTPNIDVRSRMDPGQQRISPDIPDRPKAVIRVRSVSDPGVQSVHGQDPALFIPRNSDE